MKTSPKHPQTASAAISKSTLTTRKFVPLNRVPFDRYRVPPKQNLLMTPLFWLYAWVNTLGTHLRITKRNMYGLKPPYIVLGTHHSWTDFYVTPLALFPHRANYVSELEGFEAFGEWLYRQFGCLGTRKFVNDLALVRNIRRVLNRRGILVIYPEARYANVGTSSNLPDSVAKMLKSCSVPVVGIQMHGNYLQSPIWNTKKRRGVRLEAELAQIITAEEIKTLSLEQIKERVSTYLTYDEYRYQEETGMQIADKFRAEGLHQVLYRCPHCNQDFTMRSAGATLFCESCGVKYELSTNGKLRLITNGNSNFSDADFDALGSPKAIFTHVPDWYEWERAQVHADIDAGTYRLDTHVDVEALPNAVNFISHGVGHLVHDQNGFSLEFTDFADPEPSLPLSSSSRIKADVTRTVDRTLRFSPASMFSVHTEYDYRGRGQCITLSTLDNTYFLFPREEGFNATKIQFATEYMYFLAKKS